MQASVFCLLLYFVMNSLDSGSAGVSLTVDPRRSQFFKYERFSVSCEEDEQKEEDEGRRPAVMKRTVDGKVHEFASPFLITAAFPGTDSGVYWCEPGLEASGSSVNITVTRGSVLLESPVLPVLEGDSAPLCCRSKAPQSACSPGAEFYKDGVVIGNSSTGSVILHNVSKADEGIYSCSIRGAGYSPESWMRVTAPSAPPEPPPPMFTFLLLRHLLVGTPYLLSTVLLGLLYRDKNREQLASEPRPDGVIMQLV